MSVPHGIDRSGAAGGTGAQGLTGSLNDLTDPGADRILFWDDSAGDLDWLAAGSGLLLAGTSLNLTAGLEDIIALAQTDGNFIVGDGTNWVAESGATVRTSLGLGTGDSPQFTGLEIGNASDSTITRGSAGDLAVEGNTIYRAGGTDVAIADWGTGSSLVDPAADVLMFWDESANSVQWLTLGSGLSVSGSTMTSTAAGITLGPEQASTSGTAIDFTGIPADMKRI